MTITYKDDRYYDLTDLENEVWKPVPWYEWLYDVSNQGRIKGLTRRVPDYRGKRTLAEKILRPFSCKFWYVRVELNKWWTGGKAVSVHRTVLLTFVWPVEDKTCVNHINSVTYDNRLENLERLTNEENQAYSWKHNNRKAGCWVWKKGKRPKGKCCIVQMTLEGEVVNEYWSLRDAAKAVGFHFTAISAAVNWRRKTSWGFKWEYKKAWLEESQTGE